MKLFFILLYLFFQLNSFGQTYYNNEIIVAYEGKNFNNIVKALNESRSYEFKWRQLGAITQTYIIQANSELEMKQLFEACKNMNGVTGAEFNYILENRAKPNDPRINEQYHLGVIKAFEAWDITTGGTNVKGEDVVIAIIDDGFDLDHEDLKDNIYRNPDEIPGDNKDNDGNGYIDDIRGWNIKSGNGIHDIKSHGTFILGVIGAKGNNGKGISGINWNIKLLPITTGNFVSDVILSFEYVIAERRQYNLSGGTKGSNVLVTSYSGGLSKAFASDHPIWCGVYQKLGLEGVLSVAATTNDNDNVDVVGDMPSTCTSPYMLVVNSTNKLDEKDDATGFGTISVDLSAPGEKILTTEMVSRGSYKTESGTSLSTPMVAGAAALLHSLKCDPFYRLVKSNPSAAALKIKDILMSTGDKRNSLVGKTVSGNRLNIFEAIKKIRTEFDNCINLPSAKGPIKINYISIDGLLLKIDYLSPDSKPLTLLLYDNMGHIVYQSIITPPEVGGKVYNLNSFPEIPGVYHVSLVSEITSASKSFIIL